ncbi:MAG: cupredoxin domain-containing protein [Actinomycetota bacterium]
MRNARLALLAVAALSTLGACAPAPAAATRTITIEIEHSAFQPQTIDVQRGTVVVFVIENTDPIAHEFILGDEAVQDRHEKGTEAHHGAKPGEVSIASGETETTTYEFTESGTLIFGCHLPGHYDYGMRGTVRID